MPVKKEYDVESSRLAKAIDLAIDAFKTFPPTAFSKENIEHFANTYTEWKISILNPAPAYRNIRSLDYRAADVFTFFQESTGEAVEYFWGKVHAEELGYLREDKLRKILNRGKIKGLIEYDYAVDLINATEQEGRISTAESAKLNGMIGTFANRKRK
ncbi:hypothetical protein GCM10028824_02710 [Hymenobacter segetis]|uniref:Uncharacterized protein n=1 Tax=Hymenobacter segetis TaxID=2025509 RepID=A0ABU9LSB7_9BACT